MKKHNILLLLLLLNCSPRFAENKIRTNEDQGCIISCKDELICYKFLYHYYYSVPINEYSFWDAGFNEGEFAYQKINYAPFDKTITSIMSFEKQDSLKDFIFRYAFVNNCKDTIYANDDLHEWIIKKNGKSTYYRYNKNSKIKSDTIVFTLKSYDNFFH